MTTDNPTEITEARAIQSAIFYFMERRHALSGDDERIRTARAYAEQHVAALTRAQQQLEHYQAIKAALALLREV